jgi:hypothetical protein
MDDFEPGTQNGEFAHKREFKDGKVNPCVNAGRVFTLRDDKEIEPFKRKRERRAERRASR